MTTTDRASEAEVLQALSLLLTRLETGDLLDDGAQLKVDRSFQNTPAVATFDKTGLDAVALCIDDTPLPPMMWDEFTAMARTESAMGVCRSTPVPYTRAAATGCAGGPLTVAAASSPLILVEGAEPPVRPLPTRPRTPRPHAVTPDPDATDECGRPVFLAHAWPQNRDRVRPPASSSEDADDPITTPTFGAPADVENQRPSQPQDRTETKELQGSVACITENRCLSSTFLQRLVHATISAIRILFAHAP